MSQLETTSLISSPRNCFHPADHKTKLFSQRLQILLPLRGQEIFFLVVTLLAGRDEIALDGLPSAHDRDQVVHGQIGWLEFPFAIAADAGRALAFPPLGIA